MATVGDRIDKFTLVRQLGAGGMGATWEAVRQVGRDFEQRVAIKLAEPALLRTSDGLASFRREAALAASLRHPNIAAVLDVDEKAGYIVCELVDGADLRGVLRSIPGGRLEPDLVVHLLAQIARGLNHAHRRILRGRPSPVIHRDMSPGNVVLDYDGNVKIVDFGIAKVLAGGTEIAETVKGKLSYMAPEQAMGGRMDGRVDQYALGVIAYEALSGVRPNVGAHEGETLACILEGRHVPLQERAPSVPAGLCRVVERMLALRPADRFESMDAVLDALAEFTPKLTVHRSLIPLVMAARQPHTIVSENGRFVSRPVEVSAPWSPVEQVAAGAPPSLRLNVTAPSGRRPQHMASLAVTLGNTQAAKLSAQLAQTQVHVPKVTPPPLPSSVPPPAPPPLHKVDHAPKRMSFARVFWQGMTALGVLLLALVVWVAFYPQVLQLAPTLWSKREPLGIAAPALAASDQFVRPAPMVASDVNAAVDPETPAALGAAATGSAEAASTSPHATRAGVDAGTVAPQDLPSGAAAPSVRAQQPASATRAEPTPANTAGAAAVARVRVRVLPAGKVWLDEQPYGHATPNLDLSVQPGEHVIAAGNEQGPVQRRTVQLAAEKLNVVRFELPK
ncbi:MAG TPA: protein kinase [Polyangiales bacterium]|nr:protein kinase [Polyangiales bacterium]